LLRQGLLKPKAGARNREQAVDLGDGQYFRERTAAFGPFDDRGGIIAAMTFRIEKTIDLADCGKPSCDRGSRKTALGEQLQVSADLLRSGFGDGPPGAREMV